MRDRWYSDNRDLVKWASLVHLTQTTGIGTILQIAFYRPDQDRLQLLRDGSAVPFPSVVLGHFRDLEQIGNLAGRAGLTIMVFKEPFDGSRESYFRKLATTLDCLRSKKLIVFFDPDTGIAPAHYGPDHVLPEELGAVFRELKPGDWLALYQHRQRRRNWIESNRRRFAQALDLPEKKVKTFSSPQLASDVVLFAAQKFSGKLGA